MVLKNRADDSGSMIFKKARGETEAPWKGRAEEETEPLPPKGGIGPEERVMGEGKVPLHPAVIRLPFSIFGRIGTELTGYPGFTFTEMELNDLAEVWVATGVEMSPLMQAAIATSAMTGGKFMGYFAWVKAGKPTIPGAKAIGEEGLEPEGEEA